MGTTLLLLWPWSAGSAREKLPLSHCALILLTGFPPLYCALRAMDSDTGVPTA